jgi:hypothetical protein
MKKTALLVALSLSVLACDSGSDDAAGGDGLGDVGLNDSTDATGKADALNGRSVRPYFTEIVEYGPESKRGTSSVVDIDEQSMTTEAEMVELPSAGEFLQLTVAGDNEDTAMRFFLVYSRDGQSFEIITVEGQGEFEEGEGPDGDGATSVPVLLSYFQSVSIDVVANRITVTSDDSAGETTTDLDVFAGEGTFYAYVLPVDSGWGNDLVGDFGYTLDARCDGVECGEEPVEPDVPVDDYAQARDVNLATVTIGGPAIDYTRASVDGFSLGGTEFWYRDENGGIDKTFSYSNGSEDGRKCMLASAIRFEAIMADPPASMVELRDNTNWSGSFFNWNEDKTVRNWPARAGLWAWTTGLMKWISVTNPDGTCSLPTVDTVEAAAADCLRTADGADGETKGCAAGF